MEEATNHQALPINLPLCRNCDTPLEDHTYCPACGQKSDTHIFTFRELLEEMADGLLNLDSRLWRSLIPLIFHPGRLTIEYLRGRRMYYLPPFRLYLILSVFFFLIPDNNSLSLSDDEDVQAQVSSTLDEVSAELLADGNANIVAGQDLGQQIRAQVAQEIAAERATTDNNEDAAGENVDCSLNLLPQDALATVLLRMTCIRFFEAPDELVRQLLENIPVMMIVGMPLVALFMQLCYMFSGRYYVEHIIFLFHTHAFFFLASILIAFASYIGQHYTLLYKPMDWVKIILGWYIPIYIFMAMLNVYADSKTKTFFKGLFVLTGYLVSILIVAFFALMYTALSA